MSDDRTQRAPSPAEVVQQLSVVVARGPDAGKKVELLPQASAQIGSADDNDLVLSDPKVSRYHVELSPTDDGITVRDIGSTNGTFIGAARVRDATVAKGTQIRIGDSLLIVDAARAARSHEESPEISGLLYTSAKMREVARSIVKLASFTGAVLVQGETGTGKELVAAGIHEKSARKDSPFVILDCGALSSTLVAAELFGHERGAFTGADRRALGAFERANGGTIFIDEIGELPLTVQPALLGVLQRKKIRRLGGDKDIPVDVRVVSATHRDLRGDVNRGTFREDLYYRIAGARIVVPPLRERVEDIPLLVRHFWQEVSGSDTAAAVDEAIHVFCTQSWPGNVRELRSAVERFIFEGGVTSDDSTSASEAPTSGATEKPLERYRVARAGVIAAFEKSYVEDLLARCDGNASEAARRAGMDRPYLLSLLKKHHLR